MRNTITLNGIESTDIEGLLIQSLPPVSKPLMRTEVEEIDGRDGDIVTNLGFSAYTKEFTIGLYGNFDINAVISYFNSEGTVIFSNEPDKYYNYQIIDQIDFERLIRFRTATVTMHVQPFKYAAFEGDLILDPPATNLLTIPDYSDTSNGVTVTAAENAVTITGKATTATEVYLPITSLSLDAGTYLLSATSSGTNPSSCSVRLIGSAPSNVDSLGGKYVTLDEGTVTLQGALSASKTFNYIWFYINAGQTLNFSTTFELENQAQKTSSGEDTSLVLINTAEAPFDRFDIKGNTYQEKRQGYQLLQEDGLATSTSTSSFWGSTTNSTIQSLGNGWARITSLSSTNTKNFFINRVGGFNWSTNATYTVILEIKNAPSVGRITISQPQNTNDPFASTSVGGQVMYDFNGTDNVIVFSGVTKSTLGTSGLRPYLTAAFSENNTVDLRLTIVAGDHVSDYQNYLYEPYVGGVPSPNPDYPQTVQVVRHQDMIRLTGKNLVNANELYLTNEVERTSDGLRKTITSSPLAAYYSGSATNPVGVYTVSFDARITNPDEAILVFQQAGIWGDNNLRLKDENGNYADEAYRTLNENWKRFSYTVNATISDTWTLQRAVMLYFSTYQNSPVFELRNFQIEIGPTATEFDVSRTQMYPIDLRIGKNMLSIDFLSVGGLAVTGNVYPAKRYQINNALSPIKVNPNTTYTISANLGTTVMGMRVYVQECDAYTVPISGIWRQLASEAYTFTTSSSTEYIKLALSLSTTDTTVTDSTENTTEFDSAEEWLRGSTLQVEARDSATAYEEYESYELCKIGNYQDYISKSGEDWYVHKEIGKLDVVSSNISAFNAHSGSHVTVNYSDASVAIIDPPAIATVSDKFIGATSVETWNGTILNGVSQGRNNNYLQFSLPNSAGSTQEEVKTYFDNHPTTVRYALATPADTKITSEETITQLEILYNYAHAYKGITFISSLVGDQLSVPPIIAAEVPASSDGVVTNVGNFPSKPKLTIYGTGNIGVSLNGNQIFQISLGDEGYITIDTALMEAYQDSTENLKNRLVMGDYDNFILNPGANSITFTGIVTKCIVENYSRWL